MKKIAMFLGQIHLDTQRKVILSIYEECKKYNIDFNIFSFFSSDEVSYNQGEFEYINRIDMDSYDGFILYSETIYSEELRKKLIKKIKTLNKNIVSIDYDINIGTNISTDNYYAMTEIMEHLLKEHNVKKINFIGGPINSSDTEKRLSGCKKVLEENNIELDKKRIYYGDFLVDSGSTAIDYFKDNNLLDADVYICANDQMALGAYNELTNLGYKIPDDCLLTGFDDIAQAKYSIPSITSVERREDYIGLTAFNKLMSLSKGEKVEDEIVKAIPRFRKSCCKDYKELSASKLMEKYKNYSVENIEHLKYSKFINDSASEFVAADSIDSLVSLIPKYLKKFKVNEFCMCIDEDIEDNTLNVPLHYTFSDNSCTKETIRKKDIMPDFKDNEPGNFSIITPLHYLNNYYGYVITNNYMGALYNELFRTFINNIANSLEAINTYNKMKEMYKELEEVSSHDTLTKLLNRKGFFDQADKIYARSKYLNEPMFLIFADLDGLKYVNDNMGHNYGDIFISDYANALTHINKKYNYLMMRFGGDEFVIFGSNATNEDAEKFVKELNDYIAELNKCNRFVYSPFSLSASTGIIAIDNNSDLSLLKLIDIADKDMYVAKQKKKSKTNK